MASGRFVVIGAAIKLDFSNAMDFESCVPSVLRFLMLPPAVAEELKKLKNNAIDGDRIR